MAEKLTPQQRQAVEDRGGRLLVSAAAGSGKTKVLVDRLLKYLNDPVNPANLDDFLIITYTKAAASELRGKIAAKLTEAIAADPENRHLQRQMQRLFLTKISTVHGFCGDLLREFAYKLDLSADFRVADENECSEMRETVLSDLLDRAYESAGENGDFRAFVDTQGLGRTDKLVSEIVLKVYDSARCHLNPEKWLDDCLRDAEMEGITDAAQTLWGRYLMDDLFDYLDGQIEVMQKCAELAESADGMQKPAIVLRDTLHQLQSLRGAATWDEVVARKNIDYGRLTFPRKGIDADLAERIKICRSACKKGLEKRLKTFADLSEQVLDDLSQSAAGARGLIALVRQFGADYDRAKRSRRCVDFGDLEHKTLDLLLGLSRSGPTVAAREIAQRFREIMVDEYQDSNGVQVAFFMALTELKQNCFMVGDVKQSIYQFRLADPGIFLKKYFAYCPASEAETGQGRKIMLNANFRSGGEVVDAVNRVFSDCMSPAVGGLIYGEDEMLREGIPHCSLPDPAVELYGMQVQEENHPDVLIVQPGVPINPEVDKNLKSIPVDEIRKVNELVNQHTFAGGRRIVMIHNAEKMTPQAQNALLKTLEEPVEGTVFLLMTDNPAALLPTIISRVRTLKLHPWSDETVRKVLRQRGLADDMRVNQAAQVSGGSIGRAIAVASDEEYWQRRQDVMSDFLGIKSRSDILRVSTAWKDKKDEAGDLLSDLDDMLHLLLLVRLGQADPDMISQYPGAWQQMARKAELSSFVSLMDAVRDARRLRLSQVTWQAVIERLLLRLMEESSKWST